MIKLKTFLLVLGLMVFCGCAGQGRKALLDFEKEDASADELRSTLRRLEPVVEEGETHEQYRIVGMLRHITRYLDDPEKRKMAVRGLLFVSIYSDDSDVRSSSQSRLLSILYDEDEDFNIRSAVVEGKKDIVVGKLFYRMADTSLFTSEIDYLNVYPDGDDRWEALEFLIDTFEDVPADLQRFSIDAFRQILANPPICIEETEEEGCLEDDTRDQAAWKRALGDKIAYWIHTPCPWEKERVPPAIGKVLAVLAKEYPHIVKSVKPEVCSNLDPHTEDVYILEQRSVAIPGPYLHIGLDLTDSIADKVHAANLELGFGNRKSFGIITGINIDDDWMKPLREGYINAQYRFPETQGALGVTRTVRERDLRLVDQQSNQALGTVEGESKYINIRDELEYYVTVLHDIPGASTYVHLYLGTLSQRMALQYFLSPPDFSLIVE
ncbi:MAG: hypothetical protein GY866_31235, partial [Proteobacteria bacterium]|nr:hypothetical protein [Pseudomonadota bacterium]